MMKTISTWYCQSDWPRMTIKRENMKEIRIETDFIKLDQFLKLINLVQTGGHAKAIIQDGLVKVNDQVCLQRGKKLRSGDIIEVDKEHLFKII
jgi:ribosome-associated protein